MAPTTLGDLLVDTRWNAAVAWALLALVGIVILGSLLTGDYLWATFAATVGLVAAMPAIRSGSPLSMPPWEAVLLASLPIVGRAVATVRITSTVATYLSIAALALLIAVNLHCFTRIKMSLGFAVGFVVVSTLAIAGLWALTRWLADLYLGTTLLLVPGVDGTLDAAAIETALMWEFVGAGVAGTIAGVIFEAYIRRRSRAGRRLEGYS